MNVQELHELAKKVAPLVGLQGRFEKERYEYRDIENWHQGELNRFARITHPTIGHGSLWLSADSKRITISVAWPRGDQSQGWQTFTVNQAYRTPEQTKNTSISVSATKTPEQIGKEINRRLLVDAEALYQEAHRELVADRDYKSGRVKTIKEIAAVVGKPLSDNRKVEDQGHFYFNNVDSEVRISSATCIEVEHTARSVEEARKVIEFLKTLRGGKLEAL